MRLPWPPVLPVPSVSSPCRRSTRGGAPGAASRSTPAAEAGSSRTSSATSARSPRLARSATSRSPARRPSNAGSAAAPSTPAAASAGSGASPAATTPDPSHEGGRVVHGFETPRGIGSGRGGRVLPERFWRLGRRRERPRPSSRSGGVRAGEPGGISVGRDEGRGAHGERLGGRDHLPGRERRRPHGAVWAGGSGPGRVEPELPAHVSTRFLRRLRRRALPDPRDGAGGGGVAVVPGGFVGGPVRTAGGERPAVPPGPARRRRRGRLRARPEAVAPGRPAGLDLRDAAVPWEHDRGRPPQDRRARGRGRRVARRWRLPEVRRDRELHRRADVPGGRAPPGPCRDPRRGGVRAAMAAEGLGGVVEDVVLPGGDRGGEREDRRRPRPVAAPAGRRPASGPTGGSRLLREAPAGVLGRAARLPGQPEPGRAPGR